MRETPAMPSKSKRYRHVMFTADIIQEGIGKFHELLCEIDGAVTETYHGGTIWTNSEKWRYDSDAEFYAEYRKGFESAEINKAFRTKDWTTDARLSVSVYNEKDNLYTIIDISADSRELIERVFNVFEQAVENCRKAPTTSSMSEPVVFIGHGGSTQWRDLKDHLHEHHGYQIQAYEIGARAGHSIRDIIDDMLVKSSFAILVLTGEDQSADGSLHPRLNVVHELGLFQGKLGFAKAIVLLEQGTAEFSNIHGIQQLRYSKGNIKETFGDVLATLRREFGA
jgi:predicted nucleotide-binding protein